MKNSSFILQTSTFLLLTAVCCSATTFPLPIPTRPTSFPLQRPSQAGEVVAWGTNNYGQISVPPGLTNVVAIAADGWYAVALKADGTVVAWGSNFNGERNVPANLSDVVQISACGGHILALKSNGVVVGWGENTWGEATAPALPPIVSIAAGGSFSMALKADGTLAIWGNTNNVGLTKNGTNLVGIAAGFSAYSFAADGSTTMWYDRGDYLSWTLKDISLIAAGPNGRAIAIRRDGTMVPSHNTDCDFPLNLRPVGLALSQNHTLALNGDGTVTAWGDNAGGQINLPPRLRGVIALAAGNQFSLALKLPTPPQPTTATASAQIVNGFIVGLNVLDGGEGYAEPPHVTITGGGGSGATATVQISKGIVTGFKVISAGSDYISQPTITIDPPPLLPKLAIAPSRVNVTMQVVPGKRYQLESSNDLPNFSAVGSPFTATTGTITNEFTLTETGQFFRIEEVP